MDYERFIDLDNVTLQDCCILFQYKNIETVINDGKIITFTKGENK